MKKLIKIWMIPLVLFGTFLLFANSCDKDDEIGYECETMTIGGEEVKACCNSTKCYYEWNGVKYYCDGQDCTSAAQDLVDDIYGTSKSSSINTQDLLQQLEDLKMSTGCGNYH